jgi:hypothetical protein
MNKLIMFVVLGMMVLAGHVASAEDFAACRKRCTTEQRACVKEITTDDAAAAEEAKTACQTTYDICEDRCVADRDNPPQEPQGDKS